MELPEPAEPRWPAILATLSAGGLYAALPRSISPTSPWLMLFSLGPCLIGTMIAYRLHKHKWNATFGFVLLSLLTLFLVVALAQLVVALPTHRLSPRHLLFSAAALWVTNILVFALWYWRVDAGGPHGRDIRRREGIGHENGAFLFPQTSQGDNDWHPQFVDYLFLSFNTSTALSPTDTAVLERSAKLLTMVQAIVSLITVALLAARAVNIL